MFKKVIRDLTSRKMRTILVVLSVAIGVFGVSAVGALAGQLGSAINSQYKASNPPDITLSTAPIPPAAMQPLNQTANVKAPVEARIVSFGQWKPPTGGHTADIEIVGMRDFAGHNTIARTTVRKGNFPTTGQVMFERYSFDNFKIRVGQTVTISGAHGPQTFTVAGSGANATYPAAKLAGFGTVFLNWSDAATLSGSNRPNTVYVKLMRNDVKSGNRTATALRGELGRYGVVVNSLSVADPKNPPGDATAKLIGSLLGVFAAIALLTSSFLVINTISTVVAEQRSQIGGMKAIGATTGMIIRLYLGLALLYGIFGTIVGLVLGILGSFVLLQVMSGVVGFDPGGFSIAPSAIIVGVIVGLAIPLLAALLPVWLGSRVTIREAMISYGLGAKFGRGMLARIVLALSFLPVVGVLASRNMIRNRTRVALTILGLAIAGACILSVMNAQQSLSGTLNKAIKTYHADIVAQLGTPQQAGKVTGIIDAVSGVSFSEGWFNTNVQNGDHLTDALTGLPIRTKAYDISRIVQGRWFQPGDQNVLIITEQMARQRAFKVGNTVAVTVGKNLVRWNVVGVTRDLGAGPNTFYAPIGQATRAAGAPPGLVQQVMIKLTDTSNANVDRKADVINQVLGSGGVVSRTTKVYQFQQQILSGFNILFVLLYLVVLIVAVVGALGLFGTITMNVLERQREIGVMRSVGARTGTVLSVFLTEGILLGLVGWVLALVLGYFAASLLGNLISNLLIPLTVTLSLLSVLIALIAILLVAFLAALLPSISAARTQIAQILRYA